MHADSHASYAHYRRVLAALDSHFGRQLNTRPGDPLDELVMTILSQNTSDTNSGRAYTALQAAYAGWAAVRDAPTDALIEVIRPAGLANQKAPRVQAVLRAITAARGELSLDFLRNWPPDAVLAWLTQFKGVGPKTATIVMLFALRQRAFPVDTHVHRITGRVGLRPATLSAAASHTWFHDLLPDDEPPEDCYSMHLNLIQLGRTVCKPRKPRCGACPLAGLCAYARHAEP